MRPALDVYKQMQRIADICPDGFVGQFYAGLKDAVRKPRKCMSTGICVNCRESSRMAGVERLKQIECLCAAHLAEDDAVWSVAE